MSRMSRSMPTNRAAVACLAMSAALLGGCNVSNRMAFEGTEPGALWTAMQAAAESPDYESSDPAKRWFVKENHVHREDGEARLEVYRELDRIVRGPMTGLDLRERRAWRFSIRLENTDPPAASFTVRGFVVPTRAGDEARRFFADVEAVLAGLPESSDDASAADEAPASDSIPAAVIVPPEWLQPLEPESPDEPDEPAAAGDPVGGSILDPDG